MGLIARDMEALRAVVSLTTAGVETVQRAWAAIDKLERQGVESPPTQGAVDRIAEITKAAEDFLDHPRSARASLALKRAIWGDDFARQFARRLTGGQ